VGNYSNRHRALDLAEQFRRTLYFIQQELAFDTGLLGLYIIIRRLTRRQRWVRHSQVINDLEKGKINVDEASVN